MSALPNPGVQRFCAWSGVAYIAVFCIAMIFIAHMVPPLPPSWTVEQIAAFYRENSLAIRTATAIMIFSVPLGFSWSALVAVWTSKIEGSYPVLAWSQLICGAFSFGGAYLGAVDFSSAAFRAERPAELIYLANDHGWYWMVMVGSCAVMQCIFFGIAILHDRRAAPIFPRWLGYFNIWVGVLQIPGVLICFFKKGPFAWNGLLSFWMALTVFSLWIYVDTWAMLRAIKRESLGAAVPGHPNLGLSREQV